MTDRETCSIALPRNSVRDCSVISGVVFPTKSSRLTLSSTNEEGMLEVKVVLWVPARFCYQRVDLHILKAEKHASTVEFFVHAIRFRKWLNIRTEIPELTFQHHLRLWCGRGFRDAGVGHGKSVRDQSRSGARASRDRQFVIYCGSFYFTIPFCV